MSKSSKKLEELSIAEGFESSDDLLADSIMDSIVPGICMNDNCSETYSYEPDSRNGRCHVCGTNTVESCLSLAGLA